MLLIFMYPTKGALSYLAFVPLRKWSLECTCKWKIGCQRLSAFYYLRHVCPSLSPSVCPHGTNRRPQSEFSRNL